jgi:ribosomal protein L12E/L44/L45/RPP1/RPP2
MVTRDMHRRTFLALTGTGSLTLVAGCADDEEPDEEEGDDETEDEADEEDEEEEDDDDIGY